MYSSKWGYPIIELYDKVTRRTEDEHGCLFDAFVSYSSKDEEFVVNQLTKVLEGGDSPYKLNLHFRYLRGLLLSYARDLTR